MSREFGSYTAGYFHQQIETAANDCLAGRDQLTKLWGEFLREFQPIAYAISSSEECDSGPEYPIMETMQHLPAMIKRMDNIEQFMNTYKRVAEEAVKKQALAKCHKQAVCNAKEFDKKG